MVNISAEKFAENCIHTMTQLRNGKKSTLDKGRDLDVKNVFDLVDI